MIADPNAYYGAGLAVATYDLFTGGGPLAGDVEFYLKYARRFGGPILELGSGTGRVLIPLAEAGFDVVGLDLSRRMLEVAGTRLVARPDVSDRVLLVEGSMADFSLNRRFALVIIAARSFQHVISPDAQRATLRCVHRHLEPGGVLVLDLFDPDFEMLASDATLPPREARDPYSGNLIRRTVVARRSDPFEQTVHEVLRFERIDAAGDVLAREETSWTLRWNLRREIAYLFELCGFEPIEQFSDFKESPPAYGREQLWIARAIR